LFDVEFGFADLAYASTHSLVTLFDREGEALCRTISADPSLTKMARVHLYLLIRTDASPGDISAAAVARRQVLGCHLLELLFEDVAISGWGQAELIVERGVRQGEYAVELRELKLSVSDENQLFGRQNAVLLEEEVFVDALALFEALFEQLVELVSIEHDVNEGRLVLWTQDDAAVAG